MEKKNYDALKQSLATIEKHMAAVLDGTAAGATGLPVDQPLLVLPFVVREVLANEAYDARVRENKPEAKCLGAANRGKLVKGLAAISSHWNDVMEVIALIPEEDLSFEGNDRAYTYMRREADCYYHLLDTVKEVLSDEKGNLWEKEKSHA